MTDVLFATVPLLRTCVGGLCPSLTFLQLGTWLEAAGFDVAIHDVAVERSLAGASMDEVTEHIVNRVVETSPRVLGLSCKVPADGRFSRDLARRVKARMPDITIVVGGIWPTPCHREILERIPDIDGVVLGEGERAIEAVCNRLRRGESAFGRDVPGTAFREGSEIVVTEAAPPVCADAHPPLNMDLLPDPDAYTVFPYLTSRGCPFKCTFCSELVIHPAYRETPLDRVRDDLARLDAFGRDWHLWLSDPLFGASRERLDVVCEALAETRFRFLMESRVDVLRPEDVPRLWEAGCELIYFGFESASFDTLRRVGKLRTQAAHTRYLARARQLMEACVAYDITPIFGVMNPAPGDRLVDLRETAAFLDELADIGHRTAVATGTDPGFHMYAFDYRFIRGTTDFARLPDLEAAGTRWLHDPDDIFRDVVVTDSSPEVPREAALEFQRIIRGMVHTTPTGWDRLQRSFPPQPLGGLG